MSLVLRSRAFFLGLCLLPTLSFAAGEAATSQPATDGDAHQRTTDESAAPQASSPYVKLDTSEGPIVLQLNPQAAPKSVANFLSYVDQGFYTGTIFHRVIPGFMVQGGGHLADLTPKPTQPPVVNESNNGLLNVRGSVAMARTSDPDSATSQFFINLVNNDYLNGQPAQPGYSVFAKVVSGMATIDRIAAAKTTIQYMMHDVPATPIVINAATRVDAPE